MPLTRRSFVAGIGAASVGAVAAASAKTFTTPSRLPRSISIDRERRELTFTAPVSRNLLRKVLRTAKIDHRWAASDSLELLDGWRITTPDLARNFGWISFSRKGEVTEAWAELHVGSFREDREYEVLVGDQRWSTSEHRLHFRCEDFPRVQLKDCSGNLSAGDHLTLLAQEGPVARQHRLVAVA